MMRRYSVFILAVLCLWSCGLRDKSAEGDNHADVSAGQDEYAIQRKLANFIAGLPDASPEEVSRSMDTLISSAITDSVTFSLVNGLMERYLDDPNSPVRNETFFSLYLEKLLQQSGIGGAERLRAAFKLEMARKNRPGTAATDFAYLDRDGRRHSLYGTAVGKRMLLIFYDPACGHCSEILRQVSESTMLNESMTRKELSVLAIYTEGNRTLWNETKVAMPQEWTVGFDLDSIVDRELYSIPAMPVMYLLDSDKKVLLKDAFLPEIESLL